jgi:hypothetical protein
MYRSCLFCSGQLGSNEAIESFPVGRRLAFDSAKGRLWVICGMCHRWNLAPIEERWEAVESAEKEFREAPYRTHHENIGVAYTADDTTLVRVGDALPDELATWRYGRGLRRRRWAHWANTIGGLLVGAPGWRGYYLRRQVVGSVPSGTAPGSAHVPLKWKQLSGIRFSQAPDGVLTARLPPGGLPLRRLPGRQLEEPLAHSLLSRTLMAVNQRGASGRDIARAVEMLAQLPAAHRSAPLLASAGTLTVVERWRTGFWRAYMTPAAGGRTHRVAAHVTLAMEMGMHEAAEREALRGNLAGLRARWREAEEIAAIADSL